MKSSNSFFNFSMPFFVDDVKMQALQTIRIYIMHILVII